jgi:hypothetical protein
MYDQDTSNVERQKQRMAASFTGVAQLGKYQEVLIRHVHQTIDRYLAR